MAGTFAVGVLAGAALMFVLLKLFARRTLDDVAADVCSWADWQFGATTPEAKVDHLVREAIELSGDPRDPEEMADVFSLLVHLAHVTGTDLRAAVDAKLLKNRLRAWAAPDEAGVIEHVREPGA